MNWFVSKPASADSMVQAGLPILEGFCALIGVIAVLMLLIALLHAFLAVRSESPHHELHRFGAATQRVDRVLPDAGRAKEAAAGRVPSGQAVYSLIRPGCIGPGSARLS